MTYAAVQQHPRFPVETPAQLFMPNTMQEAPLFNVSLGGLFVRSAQLWEPGTRVQTVFALPDGAINALCSVVHVVPPQVSTERGHPA